MGKAKSRKLTPELQAEMDKARERRRADMEASRAEAKRLSADPDVTVTTDQAGRLVGAQRLDVFAMLLSRDGLSAEAYAAIRDHERDVHIAEGVETPERRPDYIRASTAGAPGQNVTQQMIDASLMVQLTLDALTPRMARLLTILMQPGEALMTRWRGNVEAVTGEGRSDAQSAMIRAMGDAVSDARMRATREIIRRKGGRENIAVAA